VDLQCSTQAAEEVVEDRHGAMVVPVVAVMAVLEITVLEQREQPTLVVAQVVDTLKLRVRLGLCEQAAQEL